ncbi:LysR family transcriptional regulator [Novosphingobium sp. 9]|uniref:LysR family transcriptional regulator n=1 Tax=Novosphingobium sp. 9 TaxID=2025349 RepID=UPI0021B572C1|nr:LysR family transcriptional regulator [Novosphingobium sp. 9]
MDLRQISYFVALYEEGSVTRAAARLYVVQPAVSMQLAKLEKEFGLQLFERRSKAMVPTSAGRTLYRLVVPVLRDLSVAREHMAKLSGVISGRITVGILASLTASFVPAMLIDFAATYPEVEVDVVDGFSSTFIEQVQQGALDFAIINKPPRRLGLVSETLIDEQMMFVTAAGKAADGKPIAAADLAQAKLVLPSRRHGLRLELDRYFQARDLDLTMRLEMDSIDGICETVARSDWATVLPSLAIRREALAGRLSTRPLSPPLTRKLAIIHHPRHPLSPAADAFITMMREAAVKALGGDGHAVAVQDDESDDDQEA